jgi:hypothetical protein
MATSLLKSLKCVTLPKKVEADSVQVARNKLIARLEIQSRLAADPQWSAELKRWRKNKETGKRETVTEVGRPRPTWVADEDGVVFFIKKGHSGFVEFAKGQCGIAVKATSEIPDLCEKLIAAVKAGELDGQIITKSKSK